MARPRYKANNSSLEIGWYSMDAKWNSSPDVEVGYPIRIQLGYDGGSFDNISIIQALHIAQCLLEMVAIHRDKKRTPGELGDLGEPDE